MNVLVSLLSGAEVKVRRYTRSAGEVHVKVPFVVGTGIVNRVFDAIST